MHKIVKNYISIEKNINDKLQNLNNLINKPKIIAISKTFSINEIMPLLQYGHNDFGENKVQEAIDKWSILKEKNSSLNLHMVGKLQTNKVKSALNIFDFIHSLDNEKLAKKISFEQEKLNKKPKVFIQINIGEEEQKSGINKKNLVEFYNFCININLNIIGIMCLPPLNDNTEKYFSEMQNLLVKVNLKELSMGMSSDYLKAVEFSSTYLRIGSSIFGERN